MRRHMMHPYMQAAKQQMYEEAMNQNQAEEGDSPAAEEAENKEAAPQTNEQPDIKQSTTKKDDSAKDAAAELEDMRLRMVAEMDNFKKRLTREHQEQVRYASEKVLSDLLPALDNLDLAMQYGSRHDACRDMMQGIELTRKQLLEAVAKSGLSSVGQPGEAFNPEIHEAIGVEANPQLESGAVTRVLQRGYKLNDRLLRPAKVMVNN